MIWSLQAFVQPVPLEFGESFLDNYLVAALLVSTIVICVSYNLVHRLLMNTIDSYNKLNDETQLTVTQHTFEAIVLSVLFVPYTYLMLSTNFQQQDLASLRIKLKVQCIITGFIMIMYQVELATRHRHLRPIVVAHHMCASINIIFGALFPETAFIKGSSPLIYFIMYESVTFIGLVMYRLYPEKPITPRIILGGMYLFGLSRPVQLVWIVASLVASWEHLVTWQAIIQLTFAFTFTVLQLYSLQIHASIRRRVIAMQNQEEKDEEMNVTDDTNDMIDVEDSSQ